MKNKQILLPNRIHQVLIISSLLLAVTFSGFAQLQVSGNPLNSMDYNFNNNAWQHYSNTTYTYDAKGQVIELTSVNAATGQNIRRENYSYDSTGFVYYHARDIWRNNTWEPGYGYRYLYTYDANGNITESIYQERGYAPGSQGIISWYNVSRTVSTYNSLNLVISTEFFSWDSSINNWKNIIRYNNYLYNANNEITSYIIESYSTGSWRLFLRNTNLVWDRKNEVPLSYTSEYWNNVTWVNSRRYAKVYGTNNGWSATFENFINNSWIPSTRDFYDRDTLGNDIGNRRLNWQNNSWVQVSGHKNILLYNNNNGIIEMITQDWISNQAGYVNSSRKVYSNFTATGQTEEEKQLKVEVYPNPTSDFITIQLPETKNQTFTATLTDVTGKKVLSQQFVSNSGTEQINLTALSAGIYILQLRSTDNFKIVKIIKQ